MYLRLTIIVANFFFCSIFSVITTIILLGNWDVTYTFEMTDAEKMNGIKTTESLYKTDSSGGKQR